MRRVLVAIGVCLLVGVVINVAVAWGCELWSPLTHMTRALPTSRGAVGDIGGLVPETWLKPGEHVSHDVRIGFGLRVHLLYNVPEPAPTPAAVPWRPRMLHVHRAGWPIASLECDTISDGAGVVYDTVAWRGGCLVPRFLQGEIPARRAPEVPDPLPLRPVWRGFALNTLMYGAACWTLLGGPFTLRRWQRMRKGLCLKCGYPVRGLTKCPECGRARSSAGDSQDTTAPLGRVGEKGGEEVEAASGGTPPRP